MNKLHERLYTLLKELKDICAEAGVTFYLSGGTGLGALRNQCFLPWDDDIDVHMTRDEWDRFVKIVEKRPELIPENRRLVYNENTKYYNNPIPRYVDLESTAMLRSQAVPARACGQAIEFFILDPMPVSDEAEAEFIDKQRLYTELITPYFISNSNLTSADFDRLEKNYKEYYRRAKKVGLDTVLKELEAEKYQVREEDCEKYLYRWGFGMTSFLSKSYGEPRMIKFEDDYFPVACESEVTMRVAYGDSWMYVPERDNQIVHSTMKNLDTPFEKYTDEYVPLIDRDELFRAYRKVKNVEIEQFAIRLRENLVIAKAKALIAEEKIRRELLPRKEEVIQAYEAEDSETLDRLLACVYDTMLQKDLVRNGISPEVDEELFVIAVMNLIKQGLYYKADKLIQGVINNKLYDCEGVKQARLVIEKCRALSIAIYDYKDEKKASVALDELEDIMPELVDCRRGKLWLLMKEAEGDNEWQRLEAFAAESVERFPWDGEIEHFLGIAEYYMGNQEKARETFEEAVHKTRNAFVWQRAFELVGINRIATA